MKPELKILLKKELKAKLPGKDAHLEMMPKGRILIESHLNKRNAAVAIVIYPANTGEEEIIFIKRTEYEGPHSGQVSFPGGKENGEDINLFATSIRECYEEIGVKLSEKNLLGELTPVFVSVSGFIIYPFIFYYLSEPEILIEQKEVKHIIRFPIYKLLDSNIRCVKKMKITGQEMDIPCFQILDETVWGATGMILNEFIEILRNVLIKNPGMQSSRA
jgi:8-oxo-dGTP pyrophosphatase MutT (NUDIX family)